jgi:hypothetical protein
MLSQVLFGEMVEIIRKKNRHWARVSCTWDGTVGWVDPKHYHVIDQKEFDKYKDCGCFSLELIQGIMSDRRSIPISIGSELHGFDGINVRMPFGRFQFSGQVIDIANFKHSKSMLSKIARLYLHAPAMPGGRSILGIDPTGFVQIVFKFIGIKISRSLTMQAKEGHDIGFISQAEIGDVAFFSNDQNEIIHVGLVIDNMAIIHVHGRVKIDKLDQQGIFDLESRRYTYKLRTLRRIIEDIN